MIHFFPLIFILFICLFKDTLFHCMPHVSQVHWNCLESAENFPGSSFYRVKVFVSFSKITQNTYKEYSVSFFLLPAFLDPVCSARVQLTLSIIGICSLQKVRAVCSLASRLLGELVTLFNSDIIWHRNWMFSWQVSQPRSLGLQNT